MLELKLARAGYAFEQNCGSLNINSDGAVSGGGVDQPYDGWRVVSQFEFQQGVGSGHSLKQPE
jgi:hypothetical protein